MYVYGQAVFPAPRWRSSEREMKLSNRLAASSFLQSFRHDRRRQSPISQLIFQISQLIFDRSHMNSSHDMPVCKVNDLLTLDILCVHGPNGRVGGQRKWRIEGENAFRFPSLAVWGLTVIPFNSRSTLVSSIRTGFHCTFFTGDIQKACELSTKEFSGQQDVDRHNLEFLGHANITNNAPSSVFLFQPYQRTRGSCC